MVRVPNTGAKERERLGQIRRFESLLRELERVPVNRREAECADVRADICRRMLAELRVPGYAVPTTPTRPAVEVVDIDALIAEYSRK